MGARLVSRRGGGSKCWGGRREAEKRAAPHRRLQSGQHSTLAAVTLRVAAPVICFVGCAAAMRAPRAMNGLVAPGGVAAAAVGGGRAVWQSGAIEAARCRISCDRCVACRSRVRTPQQAHEQRHEHQVAPASALQPCRCCWATSARCCGRLDCPGLSSTPCVHAGMSRQQAALCSLVACPPSSIATAQRIASPAGAIPSPHPRSWLQLQRRQRRCAHRARTVRRIRVAIQPAAARRGSWPRSSVAAAAHPPSDAGMWRRATDLLVCATIDQPVPPAAACPCRYTIELPAAAADDSRQAGRLRRRRRSARAAAAPWRTRATRSAMASPRRSRA